MRLLQRRSDAGHTENAPAIRDDLVAFQARAGVVDADFVERCGIVERLVLLGLCVLLFRPSLAAEPLAMPREAMQGLALVACALLYAQQRLRAWSWRLPGRSRSAEK